MDRYPVAYIRRSSADADNPGDVSREAQESAVRDLAHADGHNGNLRVFDDWNRSADESKEAKRTAFASMLGEIEAGRVSAVYAYALDRLYRSMSAFVKLTKAAKAHDVRIVTQREGILGGDGSPMAQAFAQITAVFSELELNTAKVRANGALQARRQRGDALGQAPYGYMHAKVDGRVVRVPNPDQDLEPVLDAMREKRSVLGAARYLRQQQIPAPKGGERWATSLVTRIIEREAPELLPRRSALGKRIPARAMFAQLLRCQCGTLLTPNVPRGQYYCSKGHSIGSKAHGPYTVQEWAVLPFVKAEAALLDVLGDQAALDGLEERRAAIDERLDRAHEEYLAGKPENRERDRVRYDAEKARAERDIGALETRASVVDLPTAIEWDTDPPELINRHLRALWEHVKLGADMKPVKAEWRVPEWRNPSA